MNNYRFCTAVFIYLLCISSSTVYAQSENYYEIGNGACMLNLQKENMKIASFNERWSMMTSLEQLQSEVSLAISKKNYFNGDFNFTSMNLGFHCGGYGSSVVVKLESNLGEFCVWLKPNGKNFEVRSMGALTTKEKLSGTDFCHGRKWGELIIGVLNENTLLEFKTNELSKYVEEISPIAFKTYKIKLKTEYFLQEEFVSKVISDKLAKEIKYIEYNDYQHPIGDFVPLK